MIKTREKELVGQEAFWQITDLSKFKQHRIDESLQRLKSLPFDAVKKMLIQYRFFVRYQVSDLALLISKLPDGSLRSVLADILNEALGAGNSENSRPALYDKFLLSIGIPEKSLEISDSLSIRKLWEGEQSLLNNSWSFGVGLRGMGSECPSQVYLSTMYAYLRQNIALIERQDSIDWKFWDIQTTKVGPGNQRIVRAAIDNLLIAEPYLVSDLIDGYKESQAAWARFWN